MRVLVKRDDRAITNINVVEEEGWDPDYVDLFDIPDSEADKFNHNAHYHLGTDDQTVVVTPVAPPIEDVIDNKLPYADIVAKLDAIAKDDADSPRVKEAVVDLANVIRQVAFLLRDSLRGTDA